MSRYAGQIWKILHMATKVKSCPTGFAQVGAKYDSVRRGAVKKARYVNLAAQAIREVEQEVRARYISLSAVQG